MRHLHALAGRLWRALLGRYRRQPADLWWMPAFRRAVEWAVRLLCWWRGWRFPARCVDDWWWTWRWRLEILAGWNEAESVAWLPRLVRPGMTVVDAGAHIGYYTRLLARLVGPRGQVIAVEPEAENLAVLAHNLRRYRNVRIVAGALAGCAGRASLHISAGSSNHSLVAGFTPSTEVREVNCLRLDSLVRRLDFLKVDVEGGELRVLDGLGDLVARSPAFALLIEYNPAAQRAAGHAPRELVERLQQLGLSVDRIAPDGRLAGPPAPESTETVNLLCRRV
jgi:FkbM family methyltransferase